MTHWKKTKQNQTRTSAKKCDTVSLSGATACDVSHEDPQSYSARLRRLHQLGLEHHSEVKFVITSRHPLPTLVIGDVTADRVLRPTPTPTLLSNHTQRRVAAIPAGYVETSTFN